MKIDIGSPEIKHETPTCGKRVLCAENVAKGAKYELTYIPIEWRCPVCNADNSTTLIEEEDLNFSQDNIDKCRKCKRDIKIKASDIFCT